MTHPRTPYPVFPSPYEAYQEARRVYQAALAAMGRCPPVVIYGTWSTAGLTFDCSPLVLTTSVCVTRSGLDLAQNRSGA